MSNEEFVRRAYDIAEVKDIPGWIDCFNPDGVFIDNSVGITYRAPDEVAVPVENYGRAFSDMHRELFDVYVSGDIVIVQLALQIVRIHYEEKVLCETFPEYSDYAKKTWRLVPGVY